MGGGQLRRLVVAVLLVGAALPASALAAFPGQNGKIAFESNRDGGIEIFSINPNGSGLVRLTDPPGVNRTPAWSPDGTRIAFASTRDGNPEVYVMNGDGSNEMRLTNDAGDDLEPAWSPDGTQLLFVRGPADCPSCVKELWRMNADGSAQAPVIAEAAAIRDPDWAPDGSRIVFGFGSASFNPTIVSADSDGSDRTFLTPQDFDTGFIGDNVDPGWSPDSQRIAFAHDDCENLCSDGLSKQYSVYLMNRDGSDRHYLVGGDAPSWSPDNGKIAHATWRDCSPLPSFHCDTRDLAVVNADGSPGFTTLTNSAPGGYNSRPSWQPISFTGYARPKGATPLRVPLVPAYAACTAANRTHGPPLAFGSCSPPAQESAELTVGTVDANGAQPNMSGFVRYSAIVGNPATAEDEADLALRVEISDVRVQGSLADYAGPVQAEAQTRMTDRTGSGGDPATAIDIGFPLTTPCTPTTDTAAGATCSLATTLDALIPDAVVEGQRTVLQLGQVRVVDGGPDGDTATEPNKVFLRQGVFVP